MQRRVFLALGIVCCLAAVAQADLTITPGVHLINHSLGNFTTTFDVLISTDAANTSNAGDIFMSVNGGVGTNATVPIVTVFDVTLAPEVFNGGSIGLWPSSPIPGWSVGKSSLGPAAGVLLSGTLARVTVDTSGIPLNVGFGGLWSLTMTSVVDGDTAIADPASVGDVLVQTSLVGDVHFQDPPVPEPASIVLGLFAVAGLGAVAIRKHRARRAA